jgi:hypothetical protein
MNMKKEQKKRDRKKDSIFFLRGRKKDSKPKRELNKMRPRAAGRFEKKVQTR